MGVVELFVYIALTCLAGGGAVWVIGYWSPEHPKIVDKAIWFVVIVIIGVVLWQAFGLSRFDPKVPSLR